MKYIFVNPVNVNLELMPLPGIPLLIGILENSGIDCEYCNLNADYTRYLTSEKINKYYDIFDKFYFENNYENYHEFFKERIEKYKKVFDDLKKTIKQDVYKLDIYKELSKNKKYIYNHIFSTDYSKLINCAKDINLLMFCSQKYKIYSSSITIKDILFLFNSQLNILQEFYNEKVEQILNKEPNIIGIQITLEKDFLSGLFLAYIIKQRNNNIHINIGGNFIEEAYKEISNLNEFFGVFFDSISIGNSTKIVIDLVKYINQKKSIDEINNIIYLKNGKIEFHKERVNENINDLPFQSFSTYKREDYLLQELVLPVRASETNSCYWGKCIYCSCSNSNEIYKLKSAENFVDEIEFLLKKYNTKYFAFWDNALPPKYIEKVADILIEKKLNIKYTMFARLEKDFNYKLMKKLKKSGCIYIRWGLDSASKRILKYINKGIDLDTAKNILKVSKKAGVFNSIYLMLGLPTETISEMEEALIFVKKNLKYLDEVITIDKLLFLEGALIKEKEEYYKKLINCTTEYKNNKQKIINEIKKITKAYEELPLWGFLYISSYGIMRFNILRNLMVKYYSKKSKLLKKIIYIYCECNTTKI